MSKRKRIGRRHKVAYRHSQRPLPTRRKSRLLIGAIAVVCVVVIAVVLGKLLSGADEEAKVTRSVSEKANGYVALPVVEPIRTGEGLAALRKRELEAAEELLRDFPGRGESLTAMGNVWYRHGNAVEAEKFWKEALKANPGLVDVHRSLGWLYMKKGDYEQSMKYYRKALEIDPKLSEAHGNIGRVLMMCGRHEEAVEELEKAIEIDPQSSFALFLLGQAYFQQGEYEAAKKYYEAAVKIKPDYANAYYGLTTVCTKLGDRDQAKAYSATFKALKAEARKGLKGRKVEYDDFGETQKEAAITYINIGRAYRENGELPKAEELLKHAAGLDPNNIVSYMELGSLYQAVGQPAKAIEMYRRISEIQPKAAISYLVIGMLSGQLKRYDDSEEAFRKVIALTPGQSDGYRELARLYLKTRKDLPQARQLAGKALSLKGSAENYFVFAWACDENGDRADALAAVKRAMALDPENEQYRRLYQVIQLRK